MKNKNMIFSKSLICMLMTFGIGVTKAYAQDAPVQAAIATAGSQIEGNKSTDKNQMIVDAGDPVKSCEATRNKAITECSTPTNDGFKAAAGALAGITGAFAGFSAGDMSASDDPEKVAAQQKQTQNMCMLTQLLSKLADALNGGQGDTCVQAQQACDQKCNEGEDTLKKEIEQLMAQRTPQNSAQIDSEIKIRENKIEKIQKTNNKCAEEARQIAQQAQQQQQASQQPQQGMDQCQQALNAGQKTTEEPVNCSEDKFKTHPSCLGLNPGGGPNIGDFARDPFDVSGQGGASEFDMPLDESTFGKTSPSGAGGGRGGGSGGPGFFAGGSGNNNNGPASKTGEGTAGGRGIGSLYGGNESGGGGGGWGNMNGDKAGSGLSRLAKKKTDLKVPTKRKLGGHKLGAGEFGLSTDDIWTRVYLRTNTRCTKQLVQCAANRSADPYGKK